MYQKLQIRKKNKSNLSRKIKTDHQYHYQPTISQQQNQYSYQQQQHSDIPVTYGSNLPKGVSTFQQNSSITEIFLHIQTPVNYQQMNTQEIIEQKCALEDHVYFLNGELDQLFKKKLNKIQAGSSRKTNKTQKNNLKLKYNEWDDSNIERQILANHKLLMLLDDQYDFLKKKLDKTQKPNYKLECQNKIRQTKDQITKMRLFLSERKRKNVLNGKKITKLDHTDAHKQYYDLQQQYVTLTKKKEDYRKRIDKIIQDNANIVQEHSKSQDKKLQLKKEALNTLKNMPSQMQQEHNRVMYDTKCRKMELCLRKRQREQDIFKRKYYGLLKQYEKILENNKNLDEKIMKIKNQIYTSVNKSKNSQMKIQQYESDKKQEQEPGVRIWRAEDSQNLQKEPSENGFMLTQLKNQKSTTPIKKNATPPSHNFNSQKSSNRPKFHSDYTYKNPLKLKSIRIATQPNNKQFKSSRNKKNQGNSHYSQLYQYEPYRIDSRQTEKKQKNSSLIRKQSMNVQNSQHGENDQYEEDFQIQSPSIK